MKFSFSKNHRDIKNEYILLFFNWQKPSLYMEEQLLKRKL